MPEKSGRLWGWALRHRALLLVLLLCLGCAGALQYEVRLEPPDLNDNVAHLSHALAVTEGLPNLARAADPWELSPGMGYPNLHHYQHLPYFILAALHELLLGQVPMVLLLRATMVLLLAFFPLSIFLSMRRFGMDILPSAFAAVFALLISEGHRYGWAFESYLWAGKGMYSQLWGMFLMPLAVSWGYVFVKEGRGCFGAVAFLAATCLSHLLTSFVALLSLCVIFVVMDHPAGSLLSRAKRLALIFGLAFLVGAYFFIPFLRDGAYMNPSFWAQAHRDWFDSIGHQKVLQLLFTGQLLDSHRYVPLTLFAMAGLAVAVWRWSIERYRIAAIMFLLWLALYCGRPTWGRLLDLIPFSRDMHFLRYVMGVHLASLMLAGLGATAVYQLIRRFVPRYKSFVAASILIALLIPAVLERGRYLKRDSEYIARSRQAFRSEKRDIEELLAALRALPPGRVFAGLPGMWGKNLTVGHVPLYAILQSEGFDCLGFMYLQFSLNADVQYLFDENSILQYRLFNVTYVLADKHQQVPGFLKQLRTAGRFAIYQVETRGYIDVVPSNVVFVGTKREWFEAARAWMYGPCLQAGDYPRIELTRRANAGTEAIPLSQAPAWLQRYSGNRLLPPGRVLEQSRTTYYAEADVSMSRPGYVMFRSTYHPNWAVSVDGQKKQPVMLMPSYLGVEVPEGRHAVAFEYAPSRWKPWLFAMGCGILAGIYIIERRRAKRASKLAAATEDGEAGLS